MCYSTYNAKYTYKFLMPKLKVRVFSGDDFIKKCKNKKKCQHLQNNIGMHIV